MEDRKIVDLYWARKEQALEETERKYGKYCWSIAYHILHCREDAEECVSETWWRAWNSLPPQRPTVFSAFLGRITRNLSLDRYKAGKTGKRGGGQMTLALEELEECLPGGVSAEESLENAELVRLIDRFLRGLPPRERCLFLRRYWYVDSMAEIAARYHMAEGTVKSSLHRTRKKLREALRTEGVEV